MSKVYIVMGVSGCGKTTIGELLATQLSIPFYDADDFHPEANTHKMSKGIPLQDEDRWPWLSDLAIEIEKWQALEGAVLACSSLKENYRKRLFKNEEAFEKAKQYFIYLDISYEIVSKRLSKRKGHFFDPDLLQSQFDTLEVPKYGVHVSNTYNQERIIEEIISNV